MNLFELAAKITLNLDDFNRGLDDAARKVDGFTSTLTRIGTAATKAFAVAATAAGGFAVAVTKSAVDSYAEYEQLVGGMETLFKEASDAVIANAENAYKTAGMSANEYMSMILSFSASLLNATKENAGQMSEAEIEARQESLDAQYKMQKKAYDREYKERSKTYNKQYSALQKELNKEYDLRRKELDKQVDALTESLNAEIEAVEKANSQRLKEVEKAYEADVTAYEKATDARIALIDEEYRESIKLIDEEKYNRLKAIDDQIAAIQAEADAEQKAQDKISQANRRFNLTSSLYTSKTMKDRRKAREALYEYNSSIALKEANEERKSEIGTLKAQKDAIKEEATLKKTAAKESRDAAVTAVKDERKETLAAMKESHQEEMDALKESQKEQVNQLRKSKQEQITALRESHSVELEAIRESQSNQLEALRESQSDQLEALKDAQTERLEALKKTIEEEKKLLNESSNALSANIEQTAESRLKAAQIADMAIQDMSDNVNKMGTSMEMVQNAYRGFARQNYMMLDNLALGYGGTKTEMERLLKDAEKFSGVKYDITNLSDVYKAIHVIQQELGISGRTAEEAAEIYEKTGRVVSEQLGTTALEAETTIQGSMTRMKAAWSNLITGLGREDADLGELTDNLIEAAEIALDNLAPVVSRALDGIGTVLDHFKPKIIPKLNEFIDFVLPSLATGAVKILLAFGEALLDNLPLIVESAKKLGSGLMAEINKAIDEDGEAGEILKTIGGIGNAIVALVGTILTFKAAVAGFKFAGFITEHLPAIEAAVGGIAKAFSAEGALGGIAGSASGLIAPVGGILLGAIGGWKVGEWISGQIFESSDEAFADFSFKELLDGLYDTFFGDLDVSWAGFTDYLYEQLTPGGQAIVDGLFGGIEKAFALVGGVRDWVKEHISDPFINGIKNFFGIHSPSSKMKEIGENVIKGMLNGIKTEWKGVKSFFGEDLPKLVSDISGAWEDIKKSAKEKWSDIKETVTTKAGELKDKALGKFEEFLEDYGIHGEDLSDVASGMWKVVKGDYEEGLKQINDATDGKLLEIAKTLTTSFADIIDNAKTWGGDLLENFSEGISKRWNDLKEKASKTAKIVKDYLGFSEPDKGPLSNFHTYAPDMMKLFAQGIRDNEDLVTSQLRESLDFGAVGALTPAFAGAGVGSIGYDQQTLVEALTEAMRGISVEVMIGQDRIDDMVQKAINRHNFRSGGR